MSRTVITGVRYSPGPWVGMAGACMWLIGDLDPSDPVLGATWPLVAEGATVDQVLASLLAAQLRPPLNLAIARVDDNGTEVVVRGDAWASVTFETSSGRPPVELRAGQGEFKDLRLEGFALMSLRLPAAGTAPGAPDVPQELRTGVVSACEIAILSGDTTDAATDAEPVQPAPTRPFEAMFGRTVHPTESAEQASTVPPEWMAGMRRPDEPVVVASGPAPEATLPPPHTVAGPPAVEEYRSQFEQPYVTPPPPPPPPVSAPGSRFADVSWADVSESASPAPDPYGSYHSAHPAPTSYQPPPALAPPPAPVDPARYQAGAPYPPAPYAPAPYAPTPYAPAPAPYRGGPAAGGIDAELMATTQRAPSTPVATGPVVGAVRCSVGHLNPPAAQRCRVCGGPVPPQTPQPVPRPPLGVLRLSTGEVVTLDRGVILGRAPGAPEGFGRDEPYRIQLSSPDGSISRKHVEVVLQGWLVTVVDLQSTNGTQVLAPGSLPEQLPPGGRKQIDNGWTVHLDANTWFRFEVTE